MLSKNLTLHAQLDYFVMTNSSKNMENLNFWTTDQEKDNLQKYYDVSRYVPFDCVTPTAALGDVETRLRTPERKKSVILTHCLSPHPAQRYSLFTSKHLVFSFVFLRSSRLSKSKYWNLGKIQSEILKTSLHIFSKCQPIKFQEKNPTITWWHRRFLIGGKVSCMQGRLRFFGPKVSSH